MKGTLFRGQSIDGKRGVTEGGRRSAGALSFRLFCCSAAACVMPFHVRNERLVFGGEWRLFLSMGLFGLVIHAFLRCCPVFWLSIFLALQLCLILLFLLMPEFALVIGAQRVLDCRAENPDGRHFMSVASGQKSGRKKPAGRRVGGASGNRCPGAGRLAPRGRGGRRHLPPGRPDQALAASKRRATSSQLTTL